MPPVFDHLQYAKTEHSATSRVRTCTLVTDFNRVHLVLDVEGVSVRVEFLEELNDHSIVAVKTGQVKGSVAIYL